MGAEKKFDKIQHTFRAMLALSNKSVSILSSIFWIRLHEVGTNFLLKHLVEFYS